MIKVNVQVPSSAEYWGEGATDADGQAAAVKLKEMLEEQLADWYPGAEINVEIADPPHGQAAPWRSVQTISRVISAMEARIMIVTETKLVKLCVEIPQASSAENVRVVILNGNDLLALPTRTECQVMGWPLYAGGDSVMIDHMTDGGEIRQRPSAPGNALTQNGALVLEVRRDSARAVVAAYCEKLAELLSATAKLRATIIPEETVEVAIA